MSRYSFENIPIYLIKHTSIYFIYFHTSYHIYFQNGKRTYPSFYLKHRKLYFDIRRVFSCPTLSIYSNSNSSNHQYILITSLLLLFSLSYCTTRYYTNLKYTNTFYIQYTLVLYHYNCIIKIS